MSVVDFSSIYVEYLVVVDLISVFVMVLVLLLVVLLLLLLVLVHHGATSSNFSLNDTQQMHQWHEHEYEYECGTGGISGGIDTASVTSRSRSTSLKGWIDLLARLLQ